MLPSCSCGSAFGSGYILDNDMNDACCEPDAQACQEIVLCTCKAWKGDHWTVCYRKRLLEMVLASCLYPSLTNTLQKFRAAMVEACLEGRYEKFTGNLPFYSLCWKNERSGWQAWRWENVEDGRKRMNKPCLTSVKSQKVTSITVEPV